MNLPSWTLYASAMLVPLNIPVFVLLGRLVFGSVQGFMESIYYWVKPDWLSWIDGELESDFYATVRLLFWFVLCAVAIGLELVLFAPAFVRYLGA